MGHGQFRARCWKRVFDTFWSFVWGLLGTLLTVTGTIGVYRPELGPTMTNWVFIITGVAMLGYLAYRIWKAPYWLYCDLLKENAGLQDKIGELTAWSPQVRIRHFLRAWGTLGAKGAPRNRQITVSEAVVTESGGTNRISYKPTLRMIKEAIADGEIRCDASELGSDGTANLESNISVDDLAVYWRARYPDLDTINVPQP